MPISPARAAAFEILLRVEKTDAYASDLLHSRHRAGLSPSDHGLATELVMGVLRWRNALDGAIAAQSTQPMAKLDVEALTALRLGAYQLLFLKRIPSHAAINEAVELVKRARKRSAGGFVNAVLRKLAQNSKDVVDSKTAHPEWIVERWKQYYGEEAAQRICDYDQRPPMPALRLDDKELAKKLESEGIQLEPGRLLANAFRVRAGSITRSEVFRHGRVAIQDEGSQLIALLVGHGDAILDCCAAPGGKTRIIAQENPHSAVVALEIHPRRAVLLRQLVTEKNVQVVVADARQIPLRCGFNRVLVDAPCSGTGTLARNPEIKWRLKPEDLFRLQSYQLEILRAAMPLVAHGGRLIYSTCSLEPEENEQVIEDALAADSSFALLNCGDELKKLQATGDLVSDDLDSLSAGPFLRTIPGVHACDGFFAAILEKQ